jgi:uncharacterized membrane protein YedE/YeeE
MNRAGTVTVEAPARIAATPRPRNAQPRVVGIAAAILLAGAAWLAAKYGPRHGALFLVGAGLGLVLYQAAFGFTTAFRVFVADGNGRGIRAQMLMFAVATLLFAPMLASGQGLATPIGGAVAPASISVIVGAFIFAIGMQLGGG